jgi:predicted DNA-binding transcriptional regulator AlpA
MERTTTVEKATLTIEEMAMRLGIARSTAFALAKRDALPVPVIRLGRRLVVSRELIERVLDGEAIRGPAVERGDDR